MPLTPDAGWRRSSHSYANGNCLETRLAGWSVRVRDSKNPDWPALIFTPAQWQVFTAAIKKDAA